MSEIKDTIKQNIVLPETKDSELLRSYGRVIFSNEKENVCTVIYTNRDGIPVIKNGVPVSIGSVDNWFPSVGDIVLLDLINEKPLITGRSFNNYASQIRENNKLLFDIFSDTGKPVGNRIG